MSLGVPARLGIFALGLTAVFGAAAALGAGVHPGQPPADASEMAMKDMEGGAMGVAVDDGDYAITPTTFQAAPGRSATLSFRIVDRKGRVVRDGFQLVQITPPGSPCSIQFGTDLTSAAPGSAAGLYLVVSDIESARADLVARGAEVSEVFHESALGGRFHQRGATDWLLGAAPDHQSYGSFASFPDPDGNSWLLQEITARLSADMEAGDARFTSQLVNWLRRPAAA